mmetsp:Transcript_20855/g.31579  ORF Transcript_20855/g.31579 Transcript_20855/m.31579 type:complete len:81 (+) Transcript_20855:270-512(+)
MIWASTYWNEKLRRESFLYGKISMQASSKNYEFTPDQSVSVSWNVGQGRGTRNNVRQRNKNESFLYFQQKYKIFFESVSL